MQNNMLMPWGGINPLIAPMLPGGVTGAVPPLQRPKPSPLAGLLQAVETAYGPAGQQRFNQSIPGQVLNAPSNFINYAFDQAIKSNNQLQGVQPAAPAGPQLTWDFAGTGGPAAPTVSPSRSSDIDGMLSGLLGDTYTVTSGDRSAQKNASVGGAKRSYHLQSGMARDLVPKSGQTMDGLYATLAPLKGTVFAEVLNEGDHVHVALKPGRDPWTMPQLASVDPSVANLMPLPSAPRTIDLPDAVARPMIDLAGVPQEEEEDIEKTIAELTAFAPKPFDREKQEKKRLPTVLTGIAAAAAAADPMANPAAMLAAIGGGAARAQLAWTENAEEKEEAADEAVRMFNLSMAKLKIEMRGDNKGTRFRNLERRWTAQRENMLTEYQNRNDQRSVAVQELMTNNEAFRQYDSDLLSAKTRRAQVAIGAIESQVDTANRQTTGQADLDLKRFLWEDDKLTKGIDDARAAQVNRIAAQVGADPRILVKDERGISALNGFNAIAAKNKPAVSRAIGEAIVYDGLVNNPQTLAALLGNDKKKHEEFASLMRADPDTAAMFLGREMAATPDASVYQWAQFLAASGNPMGQAFMQYVKPNTAAGGQAGAR